MCIIAIYNNGQKPDFATVQQMINRNPDGVGIAFNNGELSAFKKGFKTAAAAFAFIESIKNPRDIVFHARIATHGGICAERCHPFPVSNKTAALNKKSGVTTTPLLFHNGVFSSLNTDRTTSDSQAFVRDCLYPLYTSDPDGLKAGKYDDLIDLAVSGSRVVILYPDGVKLYGRGWIADKGATFSNSSYKPYTPPVYDWEKWGRGYSHYGAYGWGGK